MSVSFSPRRSADCSLIWAQLAMPPAVGPAGPPSSLPGGDRAAGGVVDVLPQEHLVGGVGGVRLRLVHVRRVRVGRVLDVIGGAQDAVVAGLVLRPGQHHEPLAGGQVVAVAEDVVLAGDQRVVGLERHEDVAAALTVWSTPWSKNWPNSVNIELYGGDSPTSVVTLGMKSVWCEGTQPAGTPSPAASPAGRGRWCRGPRPRCPASGPGTRRRRRQQGWWRSGRRSGC